MEEPASIKFLYHAAQDAASCSLNLPGRENAPCHRPRDIRRQSAKSCTANAIRAGRLLLVCFQSGLDRRERILKIRNRPPHRDFANNRALDTG
jgi:hypothetical protein